MTSKKWRYGGMSTFTMYGDRFEFYERVAKETDLVGFRLDRINGLNGGRTTIVNMPCQFRNWNTAFYIASAIATEVEQDFSRARRVMADDQ